MTTTPKAGWYPDIKIPGGERYWDGETWTAQRRDGQGRVKPPTPTKRPKSGWGASQYATASLGLYLFSGAVLASMTKVDPATRALIAGVLTALATGFMLVAIIATGVRVGMRDSRNDQ